MLLAASVVFGPFQSLIVRTADPLILSAFFISANDVTRQASFPPAARTSLAAPASTTAITTTPKTNLATLIRPSLKVSLLIDAFVRPHIAKCYGSRSFAPSVMVALDFVGILNVLKPEVLLSMTWTKS